jgi:hypothetical protein
MEYMEFLKAMSAQMNTNMKTNHGHMKEMPAKMDDNQAKVDADRKPYQDMLAKMDANMAKIEANGKAIQKRMAAKMNTTLEEM